MKNNPRAFWVFVLLAIVLVFVIAPGIIGSLTGLLEMIETVALTAMAVTVTIYLWKRM
jgi:hypothetical protein